MKNTAMCITSNDIVLVTTYNRPQYLRICLEYLAQADGIDTKEIWICIDRGRVIYREICEVLIDFPKLNLRSIVRDVHSYHGNTYNTLEAYKEAYASNANFIYLVEDDVLVTRDFFKWHEAVQSIDNFFCSIGYRCNRNAEARKDVTDPTAYFTSRKDFASIGVCWRRERLAPIVEHARDEYYKDLSGYLARHFPNNRFQDCFTEQDGLIMRILGATNGNICWSSLPRAFHVGFTGYNRPRSTRYTGEEIRNIIHDAAKVKEADRDFGDIEAVPTTSIPHWSPQDLHEIQHFE